MTARVAVQALGFAAVCAIVACGAAPSAPVTPSPTNNMVGPFSLSGTLVENRSGRPIAGASLAFIGNGATTVTTDADGRFSLPAVSSGQLTVGITASGFVNRGTRFTISGSRADVVLDMISTAPPFSLDFYRQLVRDGFESPVLRPTRPWRQAPKFFLNTVTQDSGVQVPAIVIDAIRRVFANSVPELSAGKFEMAAFTVGTDPPPDIAEWVSVTFWQALQDGIGGQATVGPSNGGLIRIRYDPARDAQGLNNSNQCESATVSTAVHEIVHTMGFWHTAETFTDFQTGRGCPGSGRPEHVRHAAAIMYSRPAGNLDPDRDPFDFSMPLAGRASPSRILSCPDDRPEGTRRPGL